MNQAQTAEQYSESALQAMRSILNNECDQEHRAPIIQQLLRDVSLQRFRLADSKTILQGLVEAVRNGYVPDDSVNVIANAVLGEMVTWNEDDRASVLRDFLVSIADVGHSDLLRSAITVSTIRLIDGYPETSARVRGDLTLWLGYALVRNRIPQPMRDDVVRVSHATIQRAAIDGQIRGKIAWVLSTLTDITEYPVLPVDDIIKYGDTDATPSNLREQIKNNLNRRTLSAAGFY